jgi:hypothetical protein
MSLQVSLMVLRECFFVSGDENNCIIKIGRSDRLAKMKFKKEVRRSRESICTGQKDTGALFNFVV